MAKVKSKLIGLLAVMLLLFATIGLLSACGGKDNYTVTFMVDGQQYGAVAEVQDGQVTLPTNPAKDYYTFRGWYTSDNFAEGTEFKNENITSNKTVHAFFVADQVNVYINSESQGVKNLVDVVNGSYNPGEGLTFDGWYTNEECTVAWNNSASAKTLYARSVARVVFNNGYEDVYTVDLKPGATLENPATQNADGDDITVEQKEIVKSYMSSKDIFYYDSEGNEFTFGEAVNANTTITVRWKSPFLTYTLNKKTNKLFVSAAIGSYGSYKAADYDKVKGESVPVISFPGKATVVTDKDEKTEQTFEVDAVSLRTYQLVSSTALKHIIVGEGIESVRAISSDSGACSVESINLPSTLKLIDNCFNNLNSLKSISIPDGVEVILDSFHYNHPTNYNSNYVYMNLGEEYPFEIRIPDSVKNLSMIPMNFKFSETSKFHNDGEMIWKDDTRGKLLIAYNNIENGTLTVPEGVVGIQVGAFFNYELNYLNLPSTFSYVGYNEPVSAYPSYVWLESAYAGIYCSLWDELYKDNPSAKLSPAAFVIFNGLQNADYIAFAQSKFPQGIAAYSFAGDSTGWAGINGIYTPCDNEVYTDKVIFIKETEQPEVSVTITNVMTGHSYSGSFTVNKNSTLDFATVLEKVESGLAATNAAGKLKMISVMNLGADYDLASQVKTNLYLKIAVGYQNVSGVTYSYNNDNTAIVSGFDKTTALEVATNQYLIVIPESTEHNGITYTVTAIADNAFKNESSLAYAYIPSSVKSIGASAFKDSSLVKVTILAGGLETIGAHAFEGTDLTEIALPLGNLKSVGAYAFKIETLEKFVAAGGEENRKMTSKADLKEGEFFFADTAYSAGVGLYQYVGKEIIGDVTYWDVKFVASAGAFNAKQHSDSNDAISLGDASDAENIIRNEVMEGSYYYLSNKAKIYFICVKKIHANAFTDCTTDFSYSSGRRNFYYSSQYMGTAISGRSTLNALVNDENISSIFEENWYVGYTADGMGSKRLNVA